jgi:hypothetical protein
MSLVPFRKIVHAIGGPEGARISAALQDLQEAADASIRSMSREILGGVLLRDVALSTTSRNVPHKLGRRWTGYVVTRSNANAVVYDGTGSPDPRTAIALLASATVTVDLWVF